MGFGGDGEMRSLGRTRTEGLCTAPDPFSRPSPSLFSFGRSLAFVGYLESEQRSKWAALRREDDGHVPPSG